MTNSCPALILSLALAWAALAVCCYAAHAEANLFVAQDGDDAAPGTEERPLASLEAARDAIRAMKAAGPLPEGGVTVHVRGGTYSLPKTFALDAQDAGTEAAPIVYRAYGDEDVRLSGGQRIEGFHPVSDEAILARIPEEARADVLVAGLREQGITDYGELTPRGFGRPEHPAGLELFFESKPMPLAAWPNEGWATIAGAPDGKDGGRFTYEGDRPARWTQAEDLWIHGYWTYDWADTYVKVASIDPDAKLIVTQEPHGAYGYTPGKRYRALNLIEELDAPGEWYLDRANGLLYFWPPSPIDAGAPTASILTKLVSMKDTDYVTFRGFTFECARATAVTVSGGTHNRIAGCTLRNFGTTAATVSGGTHNGVIACDIYGCDKGMGISGGDRKSLTPCHNFAENNHIHHFGRWCRTYRPGVGVSGVGIRVAHNVIHDGPHNAIQLSGNDNLIEFNEIYAVCGQTGDVGAFYMGRDWTTRGNVIRYNFFHDIHGPYTHGAMAVYLDDAASGTTIFGNVFYKASRAAFIGGGRDNIVENNVFVECNPGVHIDSRGLGWAKKYVVPGGGWEMYKKLEAVNHAQPPYSERYPQLVTLLDDDPAVPKGNVIARNVFVGGKHFNLSKEGEEFAVIEDNFTEGDPGFIDAEHLNFQLKDDSPVYELGFKRIPFEEIGLRHDEFRP